jgi:ribosomal-protein-alanine N-acetyltransferase
VTRFLETGRTTVTLDDLRRYLARFDDSTTDHIFAIEELATGRHVGNVTINGIHPVHGTASTGIMIGAKDVWGRGYAYEAWSLCISHAFRSLGVRKLIAGACAQNTASITLLTRLGFLREGLLRGECLVDGEHSDVVRFGLFEPEFRSAP